MNEPYSATSRTGQFLPALPAEPPAGGLPAPAQRRAARDIQDRFPGVCAWYGESTGLLWAVVNRPDGARLLEAETPGALSARVADSYRPAHYETGHGGLDAAPWK